MRHAGMPWHGETDRAGRAIDVFLPGVSEVIVPPLFGADNEAGHRGPSSRHRFCRSHGCGRQQYCFFRSRGDGGAVCDQNRRE